MPQWSMFSRGTDLRLSGGLPISSVQFITRHMGFGSGVAQTPYTADAWARLGKGCGVVLWRDGRQEFSSTLRQRTLAWDAENGRAVIKLKLVSDERRFWYRNVWPEPTKSGEDQQPADYFSRTTYASTMMWELIEWQAGPSAHPDRVIDGLILGADLGVGVFREFGFRYDPLGDALAHMSRISLVDVGIRTTTTSAGEIQVDQYLPRDLTGTVRFSADMRNLHGFDYTETAPDVTDALAAGQGDLHLRLQRGWSNSDPEDLAWGFRDERFVDRRDTADVAELLQAAKDEIAEGTGATALTVTLTDSDATRYGRDWLLGDRVSAYVGLPGTGAVAEVADVVREIEFTVAEDGSETIRPAIGSHTATATAPSITQRALSDVGRRLGGLEKRK